jgi:hypothetical protein
MINVKDNGEEGRKEKWKLLKSRVINWEERVLELLSNNVAVIPVYNRNEKIGEESRKNQIELGN